MLFRLFLLSFFILFSASVFSDETRAGETRSEPSKNTTQVVTVAEAREVLSDDFQELVALRKSLLNEQNTLKAKRDSISAILSYENPKYLESEIVRIDQMMLQTQKDIAELEKIENPTAEEMQRLNTFRGYISTDKSTIEAHERRIEELEQMKLDLQLVENALLNSVNRAEAVELKLGNLFNLEKERNSFRMMTSIAFVALVAIVIIGFYVIALKKENIAESIFAGEKGIQFVTIFLIVISIILFGIMGVLESKELSALLGGLSGYILGRVSNNPDKPKRVKATEAPQS
uniref:hypothetical protein n=1 Tax=Ningiella ruwaisensis TaxID=2364274 RepID=UPI00109F4CB7|nr:hypothetical protein [Ningiella ruwaisensis]